MSKANYSRKADAARKALAAVNEQMQGVVSDALKLQAEMQAAQREFDSCRARLVEHYNAHGVNIDGTPSGAAEAELQVKLQAAKARVDSESWAVKTEGLRLRKLGIENRSAALHAEHFAELASRLSDDAQTLHTDRLAWLDGTAPHALADLSARWAALAGEWLTLERGAGMSMTNRLDVPEFPGTERPGALCIPPTLQDGDPADTTQAPAGDAAGVPVGVGVFLPLDEADA